MKIKHTFIIMAILFLIVPMIIMCSFVNNRYNDFHISNKNLHASKILSIAHKEIEYKFTEIVKDALEFASNEHLKHYLVGDLSEEKNVEGIIDGVVDTDTDVIQVAIYDSQGTLLPVSSGYDEGIYPNISTSSLETEIIENYGFTSINKYELLNNTKNTFCYVFKIYDANDFVGYCVAYFNLGVFENIVSKIEGSTEYSLVITDYEGNVIKSPYNTVLKVSQLSEYENVTEQFKMVITDRKVNPTDYDSDGEEMIIMGEAVSSTRNKNGGTWGILTSTSNEVMMQSVEELDSQLFTFGIVLTAVVIVIAIIFILKYLKPLDEVYTVFERRANGDKSTRFTSKGKSDVVRMGNSVNQLIDMLNESEERYNTIVDMTDNIIFEYNVVKDQVFFSDNFNSKFSFRAKTLKFEDSFFVNGVVERKEKADFEAFVDRLAAGDSCQGEFSFKTIYNDYAWYIVRCASIKDSEDNVVKVIGAMIDIDRAKRREENLLKKANYDSLTQILNRQSFEVNLMNEYDLSQMRKTKVAVLFIDLDDFKYYNNNFGHALGDEALTFVGTTLKRIVGNNGFAGRYGGDEFVMCYSETPLIQSAGEVAKEIITELGNGFDGVSVKQHFSVKCSIGIAYFTENSMDADSVIKDADEAMYSVKKNGKSDFSYYSKPRR